MGLGKTEYVGDEETRKVEEEQEGFEIVVHGRLSDCGGRPGEKWSNAVIVAVS